MTMESSPIRPSTRDAVVRAAIALFAVREGASLDDVAAAAGVARATLFRHFGSRDELVRAAGLQSLAELEEALRHADLARGTARDRLLRLLEVLVPAGQKLRFVYRCADLVDDDALLRAEARLDRHIAPVLEAAVRAGLVARDLGGVWLSEVFESLLYASWTAVARGAVAPADAPRLLMRTLLHGLGREPRS